MEPINQDHEGFAHWGENLSHRLSEVSYKGKQQLAAFIGHIKKAPHYIVDNEYIQHGYRINFHSKRKLCKSLFMLHNESVNIWSHLLGVTAFIGLLIYTLIALNTTTYFYTLPDPNSEI